MASKYFKSLSTENNDHLTEKLRNIQNFKCFICNEPLDLKLHTINIDHITPLANKGKDSEENFAVTHESCNKSKQDADLKIARTLYKLKKIQEDTLQAENKSASLKQLLVAQGMTSNTQPSANLYGVYL